MMEKKYLIFSNILWDDFIIIKPILYTILVYGNLPSTISPWNMKPAFPIASQYEIEGEEYNQHSSSLSSILSVVFQVLLAIHTSSTSLNKCTFVPKPVLV